MTALESKCKVILPPEVFDFKQQPEPPVVFLAGAIDMGKAADWQKEVIESLADIPCVALNPRRKDWVSSWKQEIGNEKFREQVEWELKGLEQANLIALCFTKESKAPISFLEMGLHISEGRMIVHCPEGFYRKGNVDIVCARYGVPVLQDFEDFKREVKRRLGEPVMRKPVMASDRIAWRIIAKEFVMRMRENMTGKTLCGANQAVCEYCGQKVKTKILPGREGRPSYDSHKDRNGEMCKGAGWKVPLHPDKEEWGEKGRRASTSGYEDISGLCREHRTSYYFDDGEGLIGVTNHRGGISWYRFVSGGYSLVGETATPQGAQRRRVTDAETKRRGSSEHTAAASNHKDFDTKKEALKFLEDHALMSVGWKEGSKEKEACYWNGKVHITDADAKKKWASDRTAGMGDTHPFGSPLRGRPDYGERDGEVGEVYGLKLPSEGIMTSNDHTAAAIVDIRKDAKEIAQRVVDENKPFMGTVSGTTRFLTLHKTYSEAKVWAARWEREVCMLPERQRMSDDEKLKAGLIPYVSMAADFTPIRLEINRILSSRVSTASDSMRVRIVADRIVSTVKEFTGRK